MNGVQTRFKCKLDVKRCKRFVFPPSSLLPRSNALKTKAIRYFQTDRTLTRIVSPPLHMMSREKFISVLFRQQQSGLSIADFCENEGYSRSRFYLWKQKYGITERELLAEASRLGVKDSFVPIVINGDTPSPGISHEAPLPSPQPSVPFPLKGKDSSEISLELPNGLKLKFKGSSGCEAALNLISKIYNANVLPK